MKFWTFVCSLLVFFNVTILIRSQPQTINCLAGDEAKEYNDRLIKEHNKNRSCHGVPPLVSDDALMKRSIDWSEKMALTTKFEHDPESGTGENLARLQYTESTDLQKWNPVESWYEEIKDYHGGFTHGTGHFTQVIWKASQKVGCGLCLAISSTNTEAFVTCRYLPAGNVNAAGQFEENVPSRKPNCGDRGNTSNQPSDSTKRRSVTKDKNLPTVSGKPISKTTPTENPDNPTSNSKHTETTSSSHKTTTVNSNTSWDTEKTLVFITISTHAILGLVVVITLSVVVYYYAISYYHL